MDTPVSCRGSPSSANAPPGLSIPLPRVCFMGAFGGIRTRVYTRPQGRESNKDSRPVRSTTDSYEGIRTGGFELHRITEARDWLACHIGYVHSDGSGRSVSDMPFGQDGTATQVNQENPLEDISEGPNRVYRFGPSNPLTIVRCTFDFVKSNRVATPADAHPKAGTMAAPSRSHRPAEACHAYATSESCSHCTGTRIRAAAPRTPPP